MGQYKKFIPKRIVRPRIYKYMLNVAAWKPIGAVERPVPKTHSTGRHTCKKIHSARMNLEFTDISRLHHSSAHLSKKQVPSAGPALVSMFV